MFMAYIKGLLILLIARSICGECENGCSGKGRCTVFDMCICNRNWMGNDCSERVCEFGLSFVDTPKGDLDSSGAIEGVDEVVVVNSPLYPYGTNEMFPTMQDSDLKPVPNSAHYYSECSNAGICNRKTGVCECFEGFHGAACQRMMCPGYPVECSGHGICQNAERIAQKDHMSSYQLWDKSISHGCLCDKGYYGGDCSQRRCKASIDPLYLDDVNTIQFPFFFVALLTTAHTRDFFDGQGGEGFFRIRINDRTGESWLSARIPVGASCDTVISALETIPNRAVPAGLTKCFSTSFEAKNPLGSPQPFSIAYPSLYQFYLAGDKTYTAPIKPTPQDAGFKTSYAINSTTDPLLSGDIYSLQFYGNPGDFFQPSVDLLSDGSRPSVASRSGKAFALSWTNGQQGTSKDYFATHCDNLKVSVASYRGDYYLWGPFVPRVLFKCLGGADFDPSNDVPFVGDWGSAEYPHLIRIVRTTADSRDGGFYLAVYWDPTVTNFDGQSGLGGNGYTVQEGAFRVMHPFHSLDDDIDVLYDVYTTAGVLHKVGNRSEAVFDFGSNKVFITNVTRDFDGLPYGGEISCEAAGVPATASDAAKRHCLDKNDLFLILDPYTTVSNAPYVNIYTALSIRVIEDNYLPLVGEIFPNVTSSRRNVTSHYHKYMITTDLNVNWAQDAPANTGTFHIYKFVPHVNTTYDVVAECSNRGICNTFEGICDCFTGYSGDACSSQEAIAR